MPALDDQVEDAAVSYLSFFRDVKLGGHAPVQEGPMDLRPNRLGKIFVDAVVLGARRCDGRIICGRAIGSPRSVRLCEWNQAISKVVLGRGILGSMEDAQ